MFMDQAKNLHKQLEQQKTMNQQQQNHRLRTGSLKATGGGVNAYYWYQILAQDSVVVKTFNFFSSHGGFLTYAMYHHREAI